MHRLTLGEGNTPLEPWPSDQRILLKREDTAPTGSHKDRAASYQVARAVALGARAIVISSSGNAGIATSRYAALHNIPAFVFVHPLTEPAKLAAIDGATTTLVITERAINGAKLVARELGLPNLRPSVHDDALVGYATLGDELAAAAAAHQTFTAVVLCATSGGTAIAVAEVLAERCPGIAVHFVQGEGNAGLVDPDAVASGSAAHSAAAGRLGVRRSRRAKQLQRAIAATGGRGHIATTQAVARAREELAASGIVVSDESAANLSVAHELVATGVGRVVCIISGAPPTPTGSPAQRITASDEQDALAQIRALLLAADVTSDGHVGRAPVRVCEADTQ